jgi:hypothetical protein
MILAFSVFRFHRREIKLRIKLHIKTRRVLSALGGLTGRNRSFIDNIGKAKTEPLFGPCCGWVPVFFPRFLKRFEALKH